MSQEYGIIMLKPDGIVQGIEEILLKRIRNENLTVVYTNKVILTEQQVLENFTSPFDKYNYARYLTSGEIKAYLIRGENAGHKLRLIKFKIRADYGYSSKNMRNLIHNSDSGTEYYKQFKLFFQELDPLLHSSYADMYINKAQYNENLFSLLIKLEEKSSISWIGIIYDKYDLILDIKRFYQKERNIGIILGIRNSFVIKGQNVKLIGYFPKSFQQLPASLYDNNFPEASSFINYVKKLGGIVILDFLPVIGINVDLLKMLKKLGVTGVHVFDSRRSLREVESIEDVVENEAKLTFSGGSGVLKPGSLSIGKYEFDSTFKLLVK
ncbi:nucleoside-diphosphate kinase [Metabacillus halosaccharovorans]|uniref:nucleoside-diphosphate kinase n=1 Tax=Metabacillus halosaccharovorans TaxID=930124 RepID=UPI00203F161D|nr:nucleoside-diphosphate kinase [Metabacillus halosaccharovorans]MCM3444725.1 hypothetical protein [Metabacillus halosaccharovorans]